MIRNLLVKIVCGILGIWLAVQLVSGVEFEGTYKTLILAGTVLGLINSFIKPVLKLITLPIRILTLGLFGLIINIGMVWFADIFFAELEIKGLEPLFWTTLLVWGVGLIIPLFFPQRKKHE